MRKLLVTAAILLLATSAQAQFLGQLSHARVLGQGSSLIGGYAGIYDDNAVAAFGQYRYGFANDIDGGFKFGILDPGSGAGVGVAVQGDMRYQLLHQKLRDPLDLSLGGGLEFFFGDNFTLFSLQGNGMVSHRFESATGRGMTPYGRVQLRAERVSVGPGNVANTDLEFGINGGGELEIAQAIALVGELQLDSSVTFGLLFGLNYRF